MPSDLDCVAMRGRRVVLRSERPVRPAVGWSVLAEGAPLGELVRGRKLPCCTLVACWSLAVRGLVPDEPIDLGAWRALAPDWWERANVWEGQPPFAMLDAMHEAHGGAAMITHRVGADTPAPPLAMGWTAVQRWDLWRDKGHAFLVWRDTDGDVLVQSDESRGYRVSYGLRWPGSVAFGLDGRTVGVLPVGVV